MIDGTKGTFCAMTVCKKLSIYLVRTALFSFLVLVHGLTLFLFFFPPPIAFLFDSHQSMGGFGRNFFLLSF